MASEVEQLDLPRGPPVDVEPVQHRLLPATAGTVVVITDENVERRFGEAVEGSLSAGLRTLRVVVASGEGSKDLSVAGSVLERMTDMGVRRNDVVLTLGGGVITDLGGFVASIYMRGLQVIHIPTTLLGQVDAAIGGKTAVNLARGKNLVGTFHQPTQVVCDVSMLKTLPRRQVSSGLAEVIKYGVCFDEELVQLLTNHMSEIFDHNEGLLEEIVARCVSIKAAIVSGDERDLGRRMLLNYGHTLGHALEALGEYSAMTHGEAISVGMMVAAAMAAGRGWISDQEVETHRRLIEAASLPTSWDFSIPKALAYLEMDKKNIDHMQWILLRPGGPEVVQDVSLDEVTKALVSVGGRSDR